MTPEETVAYQEVWQTLEHYSLLLEADAQLPSLASIVAGEPVRGSWWAMLKDMLSITSRRNCMNMRMWLL